MALQCHRSKRGLTRPERCFSHYLRSGWLHRCQRSQSAASLPRALCGLQHGCSNREAPRVITTRPRAFHAYLSRSLVTSKG